MSLMLFFLWFVLFLFVMRQKKEMNREYIATETIFKDVCKKCINWCCEDTAPYNEMDVMSLFSKILLFIPDLLFKMRNTIRTILDRIGLYNVVKRLFIQNGDLLILH